MTVHKENANNAAKKYTKSLNEDMNFTADPRSLSTPVSAGPSVD
jgi:hypothetical protein